MPKFVRQGDNLLIGNNTFSGDNTFTGAATFTGAVSQTNGASRPVDAMNLYSHSFGVIAVQSPSTTLATDAPAGDGSFDVASTSVLQEGHTYTLRRNGDYQNPEVITIRKITGTTVTLECPLSLSKVTGDRLVDHSFMSAQRLSKMLGSAPQFANRGVGGAITSQGGSPSSAGGFNAVMRLHPTPPGVYGEPSPGLNLTLWGLNDLGTTPITNSGGGLSGIANIVEAGRQTIRAVQARFNLAVLYEADIAFPNLAINTTFAGSGSWTRPTGTTYNTGVGWIQNTSAGATMSHALPESASAIGITSRIIDFCFLGDKPGGSTVPTGVIDFTIDGVAAYPIGGNSAGAYSATNKFSTAGQQAAAFNTPLPCVARFALDGAAHTIVATSNTGGIAVDWIGYEADECAPTIHTNVCNTPASDGSTTETGIPYWNTMLEEVVAEFDSDKIKIADMYNALSPNSVPVTRCWTTGLDGTHPNTYGNKLIAEAMYEAYTEIPINNSIGANL